MEPQRHRFWHLAVILACSAAAFVLIAFSCGPMTGITQPQDTLTVCALDAYTTTCGTGAFQRVSASQVLGVTAKDPNGHALATTLKLTINGANGRTATIHTTSAGTGSYSYTGATAGTDTIKIALDSGESAHTSRPLAIHWINATSVTHPIIFLHGISEDAQVYAKHQEWTGLYEALNLVYDPTFIQPFCYVDDKAWASNQSVCPASNTHSSACVDATSCISQSSVDDNAVALAHAVNALFAQTGKQVTLLGYSMGTAIIRTFLAACPITQQRAASDPGNSALAADVQACAQALGKVDQAFFFNGVQQGSWLMHVKQSWDAANLTLADPNAPHGLASPFAAILPAIEQGIFAAVKSKMGGLDASSIGAADLAPRSPNILAHNGAFPAIPDSVRLYAFYGDIRVQLGFTNLVYHLPGKRELPLGDLVLLAQNDPVSDVPVWGGAALCDTCGAPDALGYHNSGGVGPLSGQYHAWALYSPYSFDISRLAALLTDSSASQGLPVLGSPASHLNISQPNVQSPGSALQVEDVARGGQTTTDMPAEVLAILMINDGLA